MCASVCVSASVSVFVSVSVPLTVCAQVCFEVTQVCVVINELASSCVRGVKAIPPHGVTQRELVLVVTRLSGKYFIRCYITTCNCIHNICSMNKHGN